MRTMPHPLMIWLGLCALVAAGCGAVALHALTTAEHLGHGQVGIGGHAFWDAYLGFQGWAFIACFTVLVGVLSIGIATQEGMTLWLLLFALVGTICGIAALNALNSTGSFNRSPGLTGSWIFWEKYLRFHYWGGRSLGILGLGLMSAGGAVLFNYRAVGATPDRQPPPRPLGVTLIVLYLIGWSVVSGFQTDLVAASVGILYSLISAWGLWRCQPWGRSLIIGGGTISGVLSGLGGTAGLKTILLIVVITYLLQPSVRAAFMPPPARRHDLTSH